MTEETSDTPENENENENSAQDEASPEVSTEANTEAPDLMAEMAAAMVAENAVEEVEENNEQNAEVIAKEISGKDVNIETLLKVPVSLAIEVGRTKMALGDLLETQEGSVIELERLLDDPLDILVNGALIAHGVVVLANERFGIQITDIISLQDRARSL